MPALDVAALKAEQPEIYAQYRARTLRIRKELRAAVAPLIPTPTPTKENA